MILSSKIPYNESVNKARMPSSNKTGLVLKISLVLLVLLGLLVYKLNDYFRNEKMFSEQSQLRNRVISYKTTVSGQLQQLKNTLSGYESDLTDSNINWVQLAPFFAIAKVEKVGGALKVSQFVGRSNTPGERCNAGFLERALSVNRSRDSNPILVQLFQDRTGTKYLLIRFAVSNGHELAVVSGADYFQKYFDIERGGSSTSLLVTTEDILAAHTEGDYIATATKEANLSPKKYIFEKEEIVGTNLIAVSYIFKKKIASGLAIPWSIIGVVLGFGFILIGILFYTLDPLEKRVERYKKQERDQIYKDTVGELVATTKNVNLTNPLHVSEDTQTSAKPEKRTPPPLHAVENSDEPAPVPVSAPEPVRELPKDFYNFKSEVAVPPEISAPNPLDDETKTTAEIPVRNFNEDHFLTLDEEKIDLDEIEKALALDDFDDDKPGSSIGSDVLEKNLKPQKISVSAAGAPIERPNFKLERKEFNVDQIKVKIRRPEKS